MIYEAHCFTLRKTATMATSNKGNSEAVETRLHSVLAKKGVYSSVLITAENAGRIIANCDRLLKKRHKRPVNRHGKILSWIALAALGITQTNSAGSKVNVAQGDLTLTKPAASVERNFKASPHPFGLPRQLSPQESNFIVSQFGLDLRCSAADTEPRDGVGLSVLTFDCFVEQLGQEFQFKESGVVADLFTMNSGCRPPLHVGRAMRVFNLPRINDALACQKKSQGVPGVRVAPLGVGISPMIREVRRNPQRKSWTFSRKSDLSFLRGVTVRQPLRLARLNAVAGLESSRLLVPCASIKITASDVPIRRTFVPSQVCHEHARVSVSLSCDKWNNTDSCWFPTVNQWSGPYQLATVTPRGKLFPSYNRLSLTSVSQKGLSQTIGGLC